MTSIPSINKLEDRISKRIYILSNLENIIEESSYYRSYSEFFKGEKISLGNINNSEIKCKIL